MNLDDLLEEFKDDKNGANAKQKAGQLSSSWQNPQQQQKPKQKENKADDAWGFSGPQQQAGGKQSQAAKSNIDWDIDADDFGDKVQQPSTYVAKAPKKADDDLDDLIDDLGGTKGSTFGTSVINTFTYKIPTAPVRTQSGSKQSTSQCFPLFIHAQFVSIGGASLPEGATFSSLQPQSCVSLRCYKCDKKVHRFTGHRWKSSVDYLFVRNHNTNLKELIKGLEEAPGYAAYACQCKWRALNENSSTEAEQLNWMCGGH